MDDPNLNTYIKSFLPIMSQAADFVRKQIANFTVLFYMFANQIESFTEHVDNSHMSVWGMVTNVTLFIWL